jgi:TolB protein
MIHVGGPALLILIAGCTLSKPEPAVMTAPPVFIEPAEPAPTDSYETQAVLFGDLPDISEIPFRSQASTPQIQHSFAEVGADGDPDVSPDGKRLVFQSTRHSHRPDLYIKTVDGVSVTQLTNDPADDVQPMFSPDGEYIAFSSNRSGNWDIWIMRTDGGNAIQVTQGEAHEIHPCWSPDGTQVAFCSLSGESKQWGIWIAQAKAGASRRYIAEGVYPEWSPTSDKIIYQRARQRGRPLFSIWTIELVGGEPTYPTELVASATRAYVLPTWSPDGKRIAFCEVADEGQEPSTDKIGSRQGEIWVADADGRGRMRLTQGDLRNYSPVWSSTGRLFFTSDRSGHENIWSVLPKGPTTPPEEAPQGPISSVDQVNERDHKATSGD